MSMAMIAATAGAGVALAVLLVTGVSVLVVMWVRAWNDTREQQRLSEARSQALESYEKVLAGLRKMAGIVPSLEDSHLILARRGVELLDNQAGLWLALQRSRGVARGPARARRATARTLEEVIELQAKYEGFQQAVLTTVYQQSALRVVLPPAPTRRYRAAFVVLHHELPGPLWPVMNGILKQHVKLWVRKAGGDWSRVRRLAFVMGRQVVFSRKHLEQAVEVRLTLNDDIVSEYVVEHELPVKAKRGWSGLLDRLF